MRTGNRGLVVDAAVLAALGTVSFLLALRFDLFGAFARWAAGHETWHVGELAIAVAVLVIGTFGLIWRRSRQLVEVIREEAATQRLLDESLQRYRSLFDHNTDLVLSLDLTGHTTSVNPAAERITGYTIEELLQISWAEIMAPESLQDIEDAVAAAVLGEAREQMLTLVRKDGDRVRLRASSSPIVVDGQVVGIYGIAKDVTESETTQQRLALLSAAVDAATEAIAVSEIGGRLLYANRAQAQLVGRSSPDDVVGGPWQQHYATAESRRLYEVSAEALAETGHWTGMAEVTEVDGSPVHREVSLTVLDGTHILSIIRDVTEREEAIQRLRESERRYELVTRATQEIMWDADLRAGTTRWSGALDAVLGIAADTVEFDSAWWDQRLHPEDREQVVASLDRAVTSSDISSWHGEYRLMRADDDYTTIFARGHLVRDDTGTAVRVVGSMMDISERTRREEELRLARQEAEEASQAKSLFLANMSHEIRTPMNGVIGMVDLLLDTDLDPEQRTYAETVRQSGDRLLVIINDILDLSKVEAGQLRLEAIDFEMRHVVEGVVTLMASHARRKGLSFSTLGCTGNRVFAGDPDRIAQVLTNLIGNAVKFTDRGGVELRIGCAEQTEDGRATVTFEVEDSGIGLTEEQIGHLFKPFSQADPSTTRRYGGTGLGLAISRQLVEAMGGTISVSSRPGEGSVFRVELPLVLGDPEAVVPSSGTEHRPTPAHEPTGPRARVLLVEDNAVNQDVAQLMLTRLGYDVDVVEDGVEALAALSREEYAAVLMDVQMPNMDGYEATRRLRAQERGAQERLPVIAMTANALAEDRERALEAGMDDYLSKPVRLDELQAVLDRWLTEEEPAAQPESQAPDAQESGGQTLDTQALETLRSIAQASGDGFLAELVSTFLRDTARNLTELDQALGEADAASTARIAHSLRSSSASMGALALSGLLAQVEGHAVRGGLEDAALLVPAIRQELGRVELALGAELGPVAS